MNETKLWKIKNDSLSPVISSELDYEERIHEWLKKDIKLIVPNAVLIGSKVKTDHDKELDLLAIDGNGDLIVIELKRGMTPREVTSQILDYSAWAASLGEDDINSVLQQQGRNENIIEIVNKNFPDGEDIEINENQKLVIVASAIDPVTERIIGYLAGKGINIDAITFNYYKDGEAEYIARNMSINRDEISVKSVNKRNGRYVTRLFDEGRLLVGQKVRYNPLDGISGVDNTAEIVKSGCKCLKHSSSDEKYSFSGLRSKFINDNNLPLNAYFPYYQWGEWELSAEGSWIKLSEL